MSAVVNVRAFIQARMSSRRFPGKVMAFLRGRPVIDHIVEGVARTFPRELIAVLTSREASDDPLVAHLEKQRVGVFRGPLDDVFGRFRSGLVAFPCRWFFRICADSPLVDAALVSAFSVHAGRADLDIVTNVFPRSFPRGQSLELVRAQAFHAVDPAGLTPDEREHVTPVFYASPGRFRILNVASEDPRLAAESLAVDSVEDLRRLEAWLREPATAPAILRPILERAA